MSPCDYTYSVHQEVCVVQVVYSTEYLPYYILYVFIFQHDALIVNDLRVKRVRGVFHDQEYCLLHVKHVVEFHYVVVVSFLKQFDFSESRERNTIVILYSKLQGGFLHLYVPV